MTYSKRGAQWAQNFYKDHHPTITWVPLAECIDQLIATVRREALEEAATVAERFDEQATNERFIASRKHIARRIRALKDEL